MSAEETALLRAIRDTPDDDLPRLALADWLDENDDPDRAEFIRAQVDVARLPTDDPRRAPLEDRAHELLAENEPHWLGDVAADDGLHEWEFERGFLSEIAATPICLSEHGRVVFGSNPVRRWQVMGTELDMGQDLIAAGRSDWIRRVEALDLSGWFESIGEMERFLTRSDLEHLRELDLTGRYGLDDLPGILGRAPFRDALKVLRCGGPLDGGRLDAFDLVRNLSATRLTGLSAPGTLLAGPDVRTLLDAVRAGELTRLDLGDNPIEADGWDAFRSAKCQLRALDLSGSPQSAAVESLLGCGALAELRSLNVSRSATDLANIEALARSRFWRQAEELRIGTGGMGDALAPLFASEGPPHLRTLDISETILRDAGIAALCNAKWAGRLEWLSIANNFVTDEGLRTLASSGRFTRLRTLHLSFNGPVEFDDLDADPFSSEGITDEGVIALAASPSLANLRVLVVGMAGRLTYTGVDAMLNGPHWKLSGLGLSRCGLGRKAVGVLAKSPRLSRLTWLDLSYHPDLGGRTLMPLAESPHLCRLTELDLRGVNPDDEVRDALRQRLGRRLSL